jgi:protein CpxP
MRTLLFTLSLLIAGMAMAQIGHGGKRKLTPQEKADKMTAKMKTELNLTSEQEAKVRQANLEFVTKNQELKDHSKEAKLQNRTQHQETLKAILTPDQQAKAVELRKANEEKRKERRQKRGR